MGSEPLRFSMSAIALLLACPAQAWYGPFCFSDRTRELALTIPSVAGETPGDFRVHFDDNDGEVERFEVRASKSVKNAHEVVLIRGAESVNGVVGVVVTSPRSTTGFKFEIDFQKDPSLCTGAIVRAVDRPAAPASKLASRPAPKAFVPAVVAAEAPAPVTTASEPAVVPALIEPPVQQPVAESASAQTPEEIKAE